MSDDAGGKSALSEGLGLLPKPDVFDPGRFGVAWGEGKVLAYAAAAVAAEREAILQMLPGGQWCDPQQIADMIRARGADARQALAQAGGPNV